MTKTELIQYVYETEGIKKKTVKTVINSFINKIVDELSKGNSVSIQTLGSFTMKNQPERKRVHPETGLPIVIPERKIITFKAAGVLKERLNYE